MNHHLESVPLQPAQDCHVGACKNLPNFTARAIPTSGKRRYGLDPSQIGRLSIGSLAPRISATAIREAVEALQPSELAGFAWKHKVVSLIYCRIADRTIRVRQASNYLSALQPLEDECASRRRLRDPVLALLVAAARDLDIPVSLVKGVAALPYHVDPSLRHLGDIDLQVKDMSSAWKLAHWLRQRGYGYAASEMPWVKWHLAERRYYGQIRLEHYDAWAVPIDIHFGAYSVRHCATLRTPITHASGLAQLGVSDNIPLLVANMAGDCFVTVKDLNDLYLCLHRSDLDWDHVMRSISAVQLAGFFNIVMNWIRQICELAPAAEVVSRQLIAASANEPPPLITAQSAWHRWRVTVSHAYAVGRSHSWYRGAVCAMTAARYYARPRKLRLVAPRLSRQMTHHGWNQWTCVRLVPVEVAVAMLEDKAANAPRSQALRIALPEPNLLVSRTPYGQILQFGGDSFVPTVYYGLDRRLVEYVASHRPDNWEPLAYPSAY